MTFVLYLKLEICLTNSSALFKSISNIASVFNSAWHNFAVTAFAAPPAP